MALEVAALRSSPGMFLVLVLPFLDQIFHQVAISDAIQAAPLRARSSLYGMRSLAMLSRSTGGVAPRWIPPAAQASSSGPSSSVLLVVCKPRVVEVLRALLWGVVLGVISLPVTLNRISSRRNLLRRSVNASGGSVRMLLGLHG